MLKLRLLTGPRAGRQLRISDTKPVSIGRRKGRLRLHDSRVSKEHAEIYFANDVWVLRDLGSANGTYVNRKKAKGLVELEPGDLVQMGRVLMKIVRCDMIGMDTQTIEPGQDQAQDDAFDDLLADVAESSRADDDFDVDQLRSESEEDDDSYDIAVAESAPPAVEEKPRASEPVEDEDIAAESLSVASDESGDDDDSFFADLGELTDTTDGKDVAVKDDAHDEPGDQDFEAIDLEAPLKLEASDSSAPEIEVPAPAQDEEEDPFLPRGDEEDSSDDSDLISLDDESGMGTRSHGTTLLTTAHDDGTPIDDAGESDAVSMGADEGEDDDDYEPPALVGLALEHAPPQQPTPTEEEQEPEAQDEAGLAAAAVDAEEPDDAIATGEIEGTPEIEVEASDFETLPLDEGPELEEKSPAAAADDTPSLDEPDQDRDFDIDAAFDELSAGLDDSLSGMTPVDDQEEDGEPQGQPPSGAATEQEPPQQAEAPRPVDPLVGSQLDVGFIKDALSRLEEEKDGAETAADEDGGHKASASVVVPVQTPPAEPAPAAEPVMQSPPPGLTATGMNPTSVNPPEEPRRSYVPQRGGIGKWFFTLLLLASLGVGGWLINENYDKLIGSRITPGPEPAAGAPDKPTHPNDALADGEQDTPDIDPPIGSPYDTQPTDDDAAASQRTGPDPFSAGPTVIGGDALAGLTRGSDDTRPLDPPRGTNPDKVTGSDNIRQPNQPTIDNTNPGLGNPSENKDPIGQEPKDPAVTEGKPAKIVFLVDASGSLVDSLPQMLAWLNKALQTIEPNEQFAIYFFKSDKPIAIKPSGLLKPSRNLLSQIAEDWLNANRMPVFPSGRSNPTEAIKQALTLEPTDLYLLSDDSFAFHQGDATSSDALDLVNQAIGDAEVRVHGVQFFYRSDQSILETLANQYDGTFEFVRESVVPDEDPIDLLEELGNE